jgi:DNA-binding NtrC family response regulator
VRELRNAVHRAYVMARDHVIDAQWLPRGAPGSPPAPAPVLAAVPTAAPAPAPAADTPPAQPGGASVQGAGTGTGETLVLPLGISIADAERALILATLRHCRHQKERTAAVLGVSLKTLYNRLKQYAAAEPSGEWDDAEEDAVR